MRIETVHGWGLDAQFWAKIHAHVAGFEWNDIDLGFTGHPVPEKTEKPDILVTHSLGTLWAAKQGHLPHKGWVVINGFTNFTAFTPPSTLQKMQEGVRDKCATQMKMFYKQAGLQSPAEQNWDENKLSKGLQWLEEWDITEQIRQTSLPILVLAGDKDRICPVQALEKQWQDHQMIIHPEAGHALPQTHPEWCADHIKNWIQSL